MLRFLWDELPFGGIAVRARGLGASIEDMLASRADTVLIAHPEWHGILAATQNIDDPLLEVPGVVSAAHESQLVAALTAMSNLTNVVIQGVPPGTLALAVALHAAKPALRVFFAFHGAPSNLFHVPAESNLVEDLLAAAERGDVYKLGWVKGGLAPLLSGMAPRARVSTVWNFPGLALQVPDTLYRARDGRRHIGVLGSGLLMKNIMSQVLAACMLPGVVVHVVEAPGAAYLRRCASPVVAHGFLSHAAFTRVLSRMDVSMYVSVSECMPMVVLESLALGVPALTSATSLVYAVDPVLEAALVVPQFETPTALQAALLGALARRDELGARGRALLDWLHAKASVEWDVFLERGGSGGAMLGGDSGVGASSSGGNQRASARSRAGDDITSITDRLLAAGSGGGDGASIGSAPQPVAVADWRGAAGVITSTLPYAPLEPRGVNRTRPAGRELADDGGVASDSQAGVHASGKVPPLHVALFAYELAPVAAGGAGVVIAALVLELLAHGHTVTVLAYMTCSDVARWEKLVAQQLASERQAAGVRGSAAAAGGTLPDSLPLRVVCVPDFLRTDPRTAASMAGYSNTSNLWLTRSREFATATRFAYEASPFDVLEVFDYAGIGFELLRNRLKHVARAGSAAAPHAGSHMLVLPRRDASQADACDGRPGEDPRALPYLPLHVPIAVRAHGTLQLIDQIEAASSAALAAAPSIPEALRGFDPPTAGFDTSDVQKALMYRMEQFGLAAADAVLAQSPAMADAFTRSYALRPPERVLLAPPPMPRILAPLSQARTAIKAARKGGASGGDAALPVLLVYGKLQLIKGTHTVIDALVLLASGHEPVEEEEEAVEAQPPRAKEEAHAGGGHGTSQPPRPLLQSQTPSPSPPHRRRLGQAFNPAKVAASAALSSTPRFSVMFVGLDTSSPRHGGRLLSQCIEKELVPLVDFQDPDGGGRVGPLAGVEVLPPVPRDAVPAFLQRLATERRLAGAVLASELETYSMAIHELAFLDIPIVASDIPAFDAVGAAHAPFRFHSGNATELAGAVHLLLEAAVQPAAARAPSPPPLQYEDAVAPYVRLAAAARQQQAAVAGGRGDGGGGMRGLAPLQLQLVDAVVRRACKAAHDE